ncbi:MAG: cytochrome c [Chloroflexi bacterium]|nr:cytochrome c [Chloroflexota bacterium]
MKGLLIKIIQLFSLSIVGIIVILSVGMFTGEQSAHALPEFADYTGEACATCHVNPGGGGPRTLRGLLWSAQGNPEEVPSLGNILIAPGVSDGVELYDIACAACHGISGEGLFGAALVSTGLSERSILNSIVRGKERSGMPSFETQFTEEQLDALVIYVAGISSGSIEPAPIRYPLPQAEFECVDQETLESCGAN